MNEQKLLLLSRLQAINPETDPLWRGILWLIACNVQAEINQIGVPGLASEEVHRVRGRLAAFMELEGQLSALLTEAKQPPPEQL